MAIRKKDSIFTQNIIIKNILGETIYETYQILSSVMSPNR